MTDFSTKSQLEVEVSQSSLRQARSTIEAELGAAEVDVNATASNQLAQSPSAATGAGASSMLDDQTSHLQTATDHLDENIALNETRNDLLREILDAQEMTARASQGGGGGLSLMPRGGLRMLAQGGKLIVSALVAGIAGVGIGSKLAEAIPDLSPGDVVDPVKIGPSHLVADSLPVGVASLVGTSLPVTIGALVANELPVGPSNILDAALPIGEAALVTSSLPIGVAALVSSALPIGVSAIVGSALPVSLGMILASEFPISVDDLIKKTGGGDSGGSGDTSSDGTTDTTGDGATDPLSIIGAIGAGAFGVGAGGTLTKTLLQNLGSGAAGGAGVGIPFMSSEMAKQLPVVQQNENLNPGSSILTQKGRRQTVGAMEGAVEWLTGNDPANADSTVSTGTDHNPNGRNNINRGDVTLEITNDATFEGLSEREIERKLDEWKRQTKKEFEREFLRGR